VHVSRRRFEQLVAEALDSLPPDLLARTENVAVLVTDTPTAGQRAHATDADLFGLYESDGMTPDRITLFRAVLSDACDDEDDLFEEIRVTLVHEFAHHFGIDDSRLDELGWG